MYEGRYEIVQKCGPESLQSYADDTTGTAYGTYEQVRSQLVQIAAVFSRVFVRKAKFLIADK